MSSLRSRELESKQVVEIITDVYHILQENDGVLSSPGSDHGIFKYAGYSSQAQYYLTKIGKKRDVERAGLGFMIQSGDFADYFRVSVDVEISAEVTGKDPQSIFEAMLRYGQIEYSMQGPTIVLYSQPAFSGRRGWADKTFVGFELELYENDLNNSNRAGKRLLDLTRKLLYSLDYALTED